jgi:magnesium chelatase subunit I
MAITAQESWTRRDGGIAVEVPPFMRELVEEVAIQARKSEYVDQNSGVSARLPIALMENLVSNAERRGLRTGEERVLTRICDLQNAVSAVSGKVELVLEGEQEGALNVARALVGRGVKALFAQRLPNAFKARRGRTSGGVRGASGLRAEPGERGAEGGPRGAEGGAPESESLAASEYRPVLDWFAGGNHIQVSDDMPQAEYAKRLSSVKGLGALAGKYLLPENPEECAVAMELVLEGLHQHSMLSRERGDDASTSYKDMLKSMLSGLEDD